MSSAAVGAGSVLSGRYRLVEALASGGMGTVWRAVDLLLDRPVAVKEVRLPPDLDDDARALLRRRTIREAQVAARLRHPAIVTIFDVVEQDGRPWIVMELVPARSLADMIRHDGPLAPVRVAGIALRVLDAMVAATAAGVEHRDIKPANVLVTDEGRVVLTDFGIARHVGDETLTSAGLIIGSPDYLAPERARGRSGGLPADLWSLGATMYDAVEGRRPFERNGPLPTLAAVVMDEPDPPLRAGPLRPIIDGLLIKDPAHRLGADETRRMLQRALRGRPVRGTMPLPRRPLDDTLGGAKSPPPVGPQPAAEPPTVIIPAVADPTPQPPAADRPPVPPTPTTVDAQPTPDTPPTVDRQPAPEPPPTVDRQPTPEPPPTVDRQPTPEPTPTVDRQPTPEPPPDAANTVDRQPTPEPPPDAANTDGREATRDVPTTVDREATPDTRTAVDGEPAPDAAAAVAAGSTADSPRTHGQEPTPEAAAAVQREPAAGEAAADHGSTPKDPSSVGGAPNGVSRTAAGSRGVPSAAAAAIAAGAAASAGKPTPSTRSTPETRADGTTPGTQDRRASDGAAPVEPEGAGFRPDTRALPREPEPATPTPTRKRRAVLVGLVVLVLAGIIGILVPALSDDPPDQATGPTPTNAPGGNAGPGNAGSGNAGSGTAGPGNAGGVGASAPSATPSAGRSTTAPRTTAPTRTTPSRSAATPATGSRVAAPAGFTRYTDPQDGFSLVVPAGWRPIRRDTRVDFDDPSSSRFLRIDTSDTPLADPYQNWIDYEGQFRQGKSDYQNLGIRRVRDYRPDEGWTTADWEFRLGGTHVLDRNIRVSDARAHAIYWSTPQSQWDTAGSRQILQLAEQSFVPAPTGR